MDESAKLELEHRVNLYQFYIGSYVKGIAFFLAITGVLLKLAIDSVQYRIIFSTAGILCNLCILIPLLFSFRHEKKIAKDFQRLAKATNTNIISTSPLCMLSIATAVFWIIISVSWCYILIYLK